MARSTLPQRLLVLSLLLAPLGTAHAAMASYRYDPVHSQVLFSITHDGFSRPYGMLHIAKGWLRLDQKDLSTARTELDIDLTSLDMGDDAWSKAVLAPQYLDAAGARYAHFKSTSVTPSDATHGVLHGTLTLRGVTKPVDINFTVNRVAHTIYGMHTVAGVSGTATLKRGDFGLTTHTDAIGQTVAVYLELEAIADQDAGPKKKGAL